MKTIYTAGVEFPTELFLVHRKYCFGTEAERIAFPRCDAFDPEKLPYGVAAGGNKFGLTECPTCGKPPTPANQPPLAFLFRNQISATEYTISGMCQACQDGVFGPDPEDEE
jgi:hypothetical protein